MKKIFMPSIVVVGFVVSAFLGFSLRARADENPGMNFSISLTPNVWNLISIPLDVPDESVQAVLGDANNAIDTIYTYDAGEWFVYRPDHPELSTLKTIRPGYGYFVHTSSSTVITGRGTPIFSSSTPPSRHLVSGWNLVGVFAPTADHFYDIDEVFSSIGFSGVDYLTLLGMDTTTESFTTKEAVRQGDAFWMLLDAPHVYAPASF